MDKRDDEKLRVLKIRGDGALAVLQALSAKLLSLSNQALEARDVIEQTLAQTDELDRKVGLNITGRGTVQAEMIAVLRSQMPHLKDLSDDEIISQFGATNKE